MKFQLSLDYLCLCQKNNGTALPHPTQKEDVLDAFFGVWQN